MGIRNHITDELVDRLAAQASADKRSVTRAIAGLPVKGLAGQRIARALEAAGLASPSHSEPPPSAA